MNVSNVPRWCPAWVHREVADYPFMIGEDLERVIRSEETRKIWDAMRKRIGYAYREYPEFEVSDARILWRLQGMISVGLEFRHEDRLTKKQKRSSGLKASKGCNTLAAIFDQMYDTQSQQLPWAFEYEFATIARELTASHRATLATIKAEGAIDLSTDVASLQEEAIRYAIREMPALLRRMALVAESFSKDAAYIARPNEKNAPRLYFIRVLSNDFSQTFGQPLHDAVLAIASVFFDCDTLTTADVAALTLKKRRRRSR
jgi:hypothetical protein